MLRPKKLRSDTLRAAQERRSKIGVAAKVSVIFVTLVVLVATLHFSKNILLKYFLRL